MTTTNTTAAATRKSSMQVIALYEYVARGHDELSFKQGDVIQLISQDSSRLYFWVGKLKGKVGIFPFTYVQLVRQDQGERPQNEVPSKAPTFNDQRPNPMDQKRPPTTRAELFKLTHKEVRKEPDLKALTEVMTNNPIVLSELSEKYLEKLKGKVLQADAALPTKPKTSNSVDENIRKLYVDLAAVYKFCFDNLRHYRKALANLRDSIYHRRKLIQAMTINVTAVFDRQIEINHRLTSDFEQIRQSLKLNSISYYPKPDQTSPSTPHSTTNSTTPTTLFLDIPTLNSSNKTCLPSNRIDLFKSPKQAAQQQPLEQPPEPDCRVLASVLNDPIIACQLPEEFIAQLPELIQKEVSQKTGARPKSNQSLSVDENLQKLYADLDSLFQFCFDNLNHYRNALTNLRESIFYRGRLLENMALNSSLILQRQTAIDGQIATEMEQIRQSIHETPN